VFCIAVGVMAIVGLQLVSEIVRAAIVANARAVNQGDISVGAGATPLQDADLAFFVDLKTRGVIAGYAPQANAAGIMQPPTGRRQTVSVRIVDPATFPLTGSNALLRPSEATSRQILETSGNAVVSSRLQDATGTPLGSTVKVLTTSGSLALLKIAGVAAADGGTWTGNTLTVSSASWQAATRSPVAFQTVGLTTRDAAHTQEAVSAVRRQYPLANVRTTDDLLRQAQQGVETTRRFLVLIGLLALLIGGVGIVNTMQVLLARRRVEIAVLKTTGYRRQDLYLLFAVETLLLGLAGGIAGAVLGIGAAAALRAIVVRTFPLILPFTVDPRTVAGGIAIGAFTALIFGLLPIVRAAAIRPQAVFRDQPDLASPQSRAESIALVLVLSVLFLVIATAVLKSLIWAVIAVYGALIVLVLLSGGLIGVVWLLSRLPVPDRPTVRYVALVSTAVIASLAIVRIETLRGVGILGLTFALAGYATPFLPRASRLNLRMALRNIGRTQIRTATTLLALLIGVFGVGLILVLGQDLRANLGSVLTSQLPFNVIAASTDPGDANTANRLQEIPGVQHLRSGTYAPTSALAIDGRPIASGNVGGGRSSRIRQQLRQLGGIQGYNVEAGDIPNQSIEITAGRNLEPSDDSTSNIIVQDGLQQFPLRLGLGNTVTLRRANGADGGEAFTVVGFYRPAATGPGPNFNIAPVYAPETATARLAGDARLEIFYMQIAEGQVTRATDKIEQIAPDLIVVDLEDFLTQFTQVLDNILLLLTAIASLALIAGMIIVANAVALAMLERRREMGVLKALGYTSGRVLSGVLLENGLTAGLGGLLGMAPVSIAVAIFSRQAKMSLGVEALTSIAIVLGVVVLSTLTAAAVAWDAVRVRPLAVLRYE
jgi:predicted lysophospholipase L1 biosynthesis ABC-type transport system permease subunit